jgi:hypothetical protein
VNGKANALKYLTWEQFEWAMEVVHSRAFCGDFGIDRPLLLQCSEHNSSGCCQDGSLYISVQFHGQEDIVLIGLLQFLLSHPRYFESCSAKAPSGIVAAD